MIFSRIYFRIHFTFTAIFTTFVRFKNAYILLFCLGLSGFGDWIQHQQVGANLYILCDGNPRVERFEAGSGTFGTTLELSKTPVTFAVDESRIVVAYTDKSVSIYDHSGTLVHDFPAFVGSVANVFLFSNQVGIDIHEKENGGVFVYDLDTLELSSFSFTNNPSMPRSVSVSQQKARFVYSNTRREYASRTLIPTPVDHPDGPDVLGPPQTSASMTGSSLANSVGWTRVFPNGERFLTQTGFVYETETSGFVTSLGATVEDVTFTNDGKVVLLRGNRLYRLSEDLNPVDEAALVGPGLAVVAIGNSFFVLRSDGSHPHGISVEVLTSDSFAPQEISPPDTWGPYGVEYTPDGAFADGEGVVYILHSEESVLYRWDSGNGKWIEPLSLWGNPAHMVYDEARNRVYFSYTDRVNELRLDLEEMEEIFFASTPGKSLGLILEDGWLYRQMDTWGQRVNIFDVETGDLVATNVNIYLDWLYRDRNSNYLYSLHRQYGRMYQHEIGASGEIVNHGIITTSAFGFPLLHPNKTSLLTSAGNVFGVPGFTLRGDPVLPHPFADALWENNALYTLGVKGSGSRLNRWGMALEPFWEREVEGAPLHLVHGGGRIHAVTFVEGAPQIFSYDEAGNLLSRSPLNRAPQSIHLTGRRVGPEMDVGDEIGRIVIHDPNAQDVHQLTLLSTGGGLFALEGERLLLASKPINLNTPEFRTVTIQAADPYGKTLAADFLIDVHTAENQTASPIATPGLSIWRESKIEHANGVVYILDHSRPYVHRWDIDTREFLPPIPLRGVATNFTVDADRGRLFLSYPTLAVTEINLGDPDFRENMWGKISRWGSRLEPAGGRYLEIPNLQSRIHWYDFQGEHLGELSHSWFSNRAYAWADQRLYCMNSGRMTRFAFTSSHVMLPNPATRTGLGTRFALNSTGTRLVENYGHVLDADDLSVLGKLGDEIYRVVAWQEDRLLTLSANGTLTFWSAAFEPLAQTQIVDSSLMFIHYSIWGIGEETLVLSWRSSQPSFTVYNTMLVPTFTSPVNLPPESLWPESIEMSEDTQPGAVVVTFSVTDPFPEITHTLEILPSSDPNPFQVNGLDLILVNSVDYFENPRVYSLDILCTDRLGRTLEQTVVVSVTHVPRAPTGIHLAQEVLLEGDPAGTPAGTFSAMDRDPDATHTFQLVSQSGGSFTLEGNQLVLAADLPRTGAYETEILVRVTNSYGLDYTESLSLEIFALPTLSIIQPPVSGKNENFFLQGMIISDHGISLLEWFLNDRWMGELYVDTDQFFLENAVDQELENTLTFRVTDPWDRWVEAFFSVSWFPDRILELRPVQEATEGQVFDVPLWLKQSGQVGSIQFEISYDRDWFQDPGFSFSVSWPAMLKEIHVNKEQGTVRGVLAWVFPPQPGDVHLGTLTLRARSVPALTAGKVETRILEAADGFGTAYSYGNHGRAAEVLIHPRAIPGDTNGNGVIDISDVNTMQRMLLGLEPTREWDVPANDLNGDGLFTIADLSWAFRVVLGERQQPAPFSSDPQPMAGEMAMDSPATSHPTRAVEFGAPQGAALVFSDARMTGRSEEEWICWIHIQLPPQGLSSLSFRLSFPTEALEPVENDFVVEGAGFPNVLRGHHLISLHAPAGEVAFAASGVDAWENPENARVGFRFRVRPEAGPHDWFLRIKQAQVGTDRGDLILLQDTHALFSTEPETVPGYRTWAAHNLWPYTEAVEPTDSPFEGEVNNLMRYALAASALDRVDGARINLHHPAIRFTRNPRTPELRFILEVSGDLLTWTELSDAQRYEIRTPLTESLERVEWIPEESFAVPGRAVFYRLKVEGTP